LLRSALCGAGLAAAASGLLAFSGPLYTGVSEAIARAPAKPKFSFGKEEPPPLVGVVSPIDPSSVNVVPVPHMDEGLLETVFGPVEAQGKACEETFLHAVVIEGRRRTIAGGQIEIVLCRTA